MSINNYQNQWFKRETVWSPIHSYLKNAPEDLTYLDGIPFSGVTWVNDPPRRMLGFFKGMVQWTIIQYAHHQTIHFHALNGGENGYQFVGSRLDALELGSEDIIESTSNDLYYSMHDPIQRALLPQLQHQFEKWMSSRAYSLKQEPELLESGHDYFALYEAQALVRAQLVREDKCSEKIRYIVAIDVGYDMLDLRIAASLVLYDLETKQIVLTKTNQSDIQLPHYCNDLFPHTDLEVVKPLFEGLPMRPDIVICNAQGLAHPRRLGLACYIGVEFGLPTFGCTRDRVVGGYEPTHLKAKSGSIQPLKWAGQVGVGNALRISTGKLPVFVSAGHQITLETATHWVRTLKKVKIEGMDATDRQLQLLQKAEQLVNQQLDERTKLLFLETV